MPFPFVSRVPQSQVLPSGLATTAPPNALVPRLPSSSALPSWYSARRAPLCSTTKMREPAAVVVMAPALSVSRVASVPSGRTRWRTIGVVSGELCGYSAITISVLAAGVGVTVALGLGEPPVDVGELPQAASNTAAVATPIETRAVILYPPNAFASPDAVNSSGG